MDIHAAKGGLERLSSDYAESIRALMCRTCTEETTPPGYMLSPTEVEALFNNDARGRLADVCGVFGTFDDHHKLLGFVALQPLELDGLQCLEFMIFFDKPAPRTNTALDAARAATAACRRRTSDPIATLVYHRNDQAKRFYTKAGFVFDRDVDCEGHRLELWTFSDGGTAMHEQLEQQANDVAINHRVYIDTPVSRVFELLTTAEGWNGWFTTRATVDHKPGGSITLEWKDFGADRYTAHDFGKVVRFLQDQEFSFTWHPGDKETTVIFKLEPRGNGCMLKVEEKGYRFVPSDMTVALQVATGWGEAMTLFKFYAERGLVYGSVPQH